MQYITNHFSSQSLNEDDKKSTENVSLNRSATMSKFIHGVRFILMNELKFVDKQREKYPFIK